MFCRDCKYWGPEKEAHKAMWKRENDPAIGARSCGRKDVKMFSEHCASFDYYGKPWTLADFGCVQFEGR